MKERIYYAENVSLDLSVVVDDIIDQLKQQHFKDVEWDGDRGGEYVWGTREVVEGFKPRRVVIVIPPIVLESEIYEECDYK